MSLKKRKVKFVALEDEAGGREGEGGWEIFVDGVPITTVENDEMDVSDQKLNKLWESLNIELIFDYV